MSKGGFYWHFKDRQSLFEEMLDAWEKAGTEDIIARVDSQPADPEPSCSSSSSRPRRLA